MRSATNRSRTTAVRLIVLLAGSFLPSGVVGAAIDVAGVAAPPVDESLSESQIVVAKGWGQCGGYQYSGPTECEEGFSCHRKHQHYSQCLPTSTAEITPTVDSQAVFMTRPPPAEPEPTTPSLPLSTAEGDGRTGAVIPLTTSTH